MNKKSYLLSLIFVWILLWAICGGFGLQFFLHYLKYPGERIAFYGIVVMLGVGIVFSWIWLVACRSYWRNQQIFDRGRSTMELGLPHDLFDSSVPLSIQGKELKINRGFRIESLPLSQICWIHRHSFPVRRGPSSMLVHFYPYKGKPVRGLFSAGNINAVLSILDHLQEIQPQLWLSKGFYSAEYRTYKKMYLNRARGMIVR